MRIDHAPSGRTIVTLRDLRQWSVFAALVALLTITFLILRPAPPPANAQANILFNLGSALANVNAPINITTATTTQIVAAPTGTGPGGALQSIYVMSENFIASVTPSTFQWVYGTGTNCGTGQGILSGAYSLNSQSGLSMGSGFGAVLIVPAGNALCAITTGTTPGFYGSITYRVF